MAALTILGDGEEFATFDRLAEDLAARFSCSVGEARSVLSRELRAADRDLDRVSRALGISS